MKSILFSTSLLMMNRIGVNGQCADGIMQFPGSPVMPIGVCNINGGDGSMKMTCGSTGDQVIQTQYTSQDCSGTVLAQQEITSQLQSFDCSAQTDCNIITIHQWDIADTETCDNYNDALSNNLVHSISLTLNGYTGFLNNCGDLDEDGNYEVLSVWSNQFSCNEGTDGVILEKENFGSDNLCQDSSSQGSETFADGTNGQQSAAQVAAGTKTCTYVPANACTDATALASAVWDQAQWELAHTPTSEPTADPTTAEPTAATANPTANPTVNPTAEPTSNPTTADDQDEDQDDEDSDDNGSSASTMAYSLAVLSVVSYYIIIA